MRCGACGRLAVILVPCDGETAAKVCLRCLRRLYTTSTALAAGLMGAAV